MCRLFGGSDVSLSSIRAAWANRDRAMPARVIAIWDDGAFTLRTAYYPVETTIAKLKLLGFKEPVEQELVATLQTGGLLNPPGSPSE